MALGGRQAQHHLLTSSLFLSGFLEGHSLSGLIGDVKAGKAPRVFIVDYDAYLAEYAPKVNSQGQDRCLYAGRALFYERCAFLPASFLVFLSRFLVPSCFRVRKVIAQGLRC